MTQMDELRQAVDSISRHTGPMLSAYLSVNAAIPENQERAYLVRLKDAMDEQGVPEELQLKVREYVEENVDLGAPEARSWSVWKARESGPRKSARKSPWTRSGRAVSGGSTRPYPPCRKRTASTSSSCCGSWRARSVGATTTGSP